MQTIIGVLTLDIHIPYSGSLKEKRMVVKSIKDKLHHKFNVSVAEVDFTDKWQRTRLGIVQVGSDYKYIEKNMDIIFNLIDSNDAIEIVDHNFEFI